MYNWYYIVNTDDLRALNLVSKTYALNLIGIGQKDVMVTLGNLLGITYEGIFLPVNLNEKNPFKFDSMAVYLDATNNLWMGFLQ